jgi:GAF domain-containing protein
VTNAPKPIEVDASRKRRQSRYERIRGDLEAMLEGEDDWIAIMSTVACELHHAFGYFDWSGFYRRVEPEMLLVGPYQGTHGCLRIELSNGICGAAARTGETQHVDDVSTRSDHIACSTSTRSEIVVPVCDASGAVAAVLDVDSDQPAAFEQVDRHQLEDLCNDLVPSVPLRSDLFAESSP